CSPGVAAKKPWCCSATSAVAMPASSRCWSDAGSSKGRCRSSVSGEGGDGSEARLTQARLQDTRIGTAGGNRGGVHRCSCFPRRFEPPRCRPVLCTGGLVFHCL